MGLAWGGLAWAGMGLAWAGLGVAWGGRWPGASLGLGLGSAWAGLGCWRNAALAGRVPSPRGVGTSPPWRGGRPPPLGKWGCPFLG